MPSNSTIPALLETIGSFGQKFNTELALDTDSIEKIEVGIEILPETALKGTFEEATIFIVTFSPASSVPRAGLIKRFAASRVVGIKKVARPKKDKIIFD